ncbi:hypothetical protein PQX77_014706 [Marasmius sp. AFHP31]|nr:hypothetical protein PQX77_014706 [Marasmius sp. AFHP31]
MSRLDDVLSGGEATVITQTSTSNNDKPEPPSWCFHEQFGQVVHFTPCDVCKMFLLHCSQGAVEEGITWREACVSRQDYYCRISGLLAKCDSLELKIDRHKSDYNYLWSQNKQATKELTELQTAHRDLLTEYDLKIVETKRLKGEIRALHASCSDQQSKKRRIDATVDSSEPAPMIIDDQGGPGQGSTASSSSTARDCPWDDGLYRTGDDLEAARLAWEQGKPIPKLGRNGRPFPRKWTSPTTREAVAQYYDKLKASSDAGKEAKGVPEDTRTEVQQEFVKLHYKPEFMLEKWKANSSGTSPTLISSKPLSQPPKLAPLEAYIKFASYKAVNGGVPLGIRRFEDGSISVRTVRGYREFYFYWMLRFKYQRFFTELCLTPGFYSSYISSHPIPNDVPAPAIRSYTLDLHNLTLDSLSEFFREQQVTVADLKDAALFSAFWLAGPIPSNDIHHSEECRRLSQRLSPLLVQHGIPAGKNEDIYFPDGRTEAHVSTVTKELPGTATAPSGSPNESITESSVEETATASPSDNSTVLSAQNSADEDAVMVSASINASTDANKSE